MRFPDRLVGICPVDECDGLLVSVHLYRFEILADHVQKALCRPYVSLARWYRDQYSVSCRHGFFHGSHVCRADINQDLVVDTAIGLSSSGYLVGHSQDLFIIKGDFINQSANTTDWNTAQASLKFVKDAGGDADHQFYIPGVDNGPTGTNPFKWGTLTIAGQTVHLLDGNADLGGAQYVGGLIGASLSGTTVTNIFGDATSTLNIYYDPLVAANLYLKGRTYDFAGGLGQLIPDPPAHTPVPPSVLLLGSGLLGLGLLGRRRKRG